MRRKRPLLSCHECRRRKLKCDRTIPCLRCRRGGAECSYGRDILTPSPSLVHQASTTCSSSQAPQPTPRSVPTDQSPIPNATETLGRTGQNHTSPERPTASNKGAGTAVFSGPSGARQCESTAQYAHDQDDGLRPLKGFFSKGCLMGSSNWMNTFTKYNSLCASGVHTAHVVEEPLAESSALSEVYDIWQNAKVLGRLIKASYSLSDISLDDSFGTLPARNIANTFVHNYIKTMEMTFRILHIPSFMKVYEQYWESPRSIRPAYIAQILLVLSIGARFSYPDERGPTWNTHQWLHSARCWTLSSSHRECFTIEGLQNKCLVLVSEQVNAIGGHPLHFVASALLQSAIYMGLHRDPSHFAPNISTFEGEMRRRLWLTIVEIHIQAALDEGMMSIISGDMYDTKPPLNVDDKDLDQDMVMLPRSQESSLWTQTSLQLVLQRSMGARLETLCSVNQPLYKLSYEETLAQSTKLVKLCQDSDGLLRQLGPPPAGYASLPFYLNMLNCLLRRFILALHRPFIGANMRDPRFYFSRKMCLENCLALTLPESDETFHRLLVVGQGFFRETFQHAGVTICIEMLLRLAENALDWATARVNETIGETFDKAVQSVLALDSQRLSNGETNIKGHVYLSMALAQIKATQAHRDPKPHMVHAAKESATFCLELLQKVASDADLLLNGNSILPENDVTDQWSIDDLGLELIPFDLDALGLWDF